MVGTAKEHFVVWEAERREDEDGGYKEVLSKIEDYARRKKLEQVANDDVDMNNVDPGEGGDKGSAEWEWGNAGWR